MSDGKENILEDHYRWHDPLLTPHLTPVDILQKCASSPQLRQRCTWEFWHNYWKNRHSSYDERSALIYRMISGTEKDRYNKAFLRGSTTLSFDIYYPERSGDLPSGELIDMAINNGHTEFIKLLIRQGIELNILYIISKAVAGYDVSVFLNYFKKKDIEKFLEENFRSVMGEIMSVSNLGSTVQELFDYVQQILYSFIKRIKFCVERYGEDILNIGTHLFYQRVFTRLRRYVEYFKRRLPNEELLELINFDHTTTLDDFYIILIR